MCQCASVALNRGSWSPRATALGRSWYGATGGQGEFSGTMSWESWAAAPLAVQCWEGPLEGPLGAKIWSWFRVAIRYVWRVSCYYSTTRDDDDNYDIVKIGKNRRAKHLTAQIFCICID